MGEDRRSAHPLAQLKLAGLNRGGRAEYARKSPKRGRAAPDQLLALKLLRDPRDAGAPLDDDRLRLTERSRPRPQYPEGRARGDDRQRRQDDEQDERAFHGAQDRARSPS